VVVAVMSVTFGSGFVYFNNFSAKQSLEKIERCTDQQNKDC